MTGADRPPASPPTAATADPSPAPAGRPRRSSPAGRSVTGARASVGGRARRSVTGASRSSPSRRRRLSRSATGASRSSPSSAAGALTRSVTGASRSSRPRRRPGVTRSVTGASRSSVARRRRRPGRSPAPARRLPRRRPGPHQVRHRRSASVAGCSRGDFDCPQIGYVGGGRSAAQRIARLGRQVVRGAAAGTAGGRCAHDLVDRLGNGLERRGGRCGCRCRARGGRRVGCGGWSERVGVYGQGSPQVGGCLLGGRRLGGGGRLFGGGRCVLGSGGGVGGGVGSRRLGAPRERDRRGRARSARGGDAASSGAGAVGLRGGGNGASGAGAVGAGAVVGAVLVGAGAVGTGAGATLVLCGAGNSSGASWTTDEVSGRLVGSWANASAETGRSRKSAPRRAHRTACATAIGRLPLSSNSPPSAPLCALSVPEVARNLCSTHKYAKDPTGSEAFSRNLRAFSYPNRPANARLGSTLNSTIEGRWVRIEADPNGPTRTRSGDKATTATPTG